MNQENEKPILKTIFIRRDIILARIEMQINILAKARGENGLPDQTLNLSEQHKAILVDWINKYLKKAESRMAAYVVKERRKSQMDFAEDWEEKVINLSMPYYWKEETFEQLSMAINDYIVNSVLEEYLTLVYTSKDPIVVNKLTIADELYSDIKHYCLSSVPHSIKKKLRPF